MKAGALVRTAWAILGGCLLLSACAWGRDASLPTPYPTEYLPTVIAMTVEAARTEQRPPATAILPTATDTPGSGATLPIRVTPSPTATRRTATPSPAAQNRTQGIPPTVTPGRRPTRTPTITPTPTIPSASVYFNIGHLSRLVSPIDLSAFIRLGASERVSLELLGEDGRTLYRKVLRYDLPVGTSVRVADEIEFELPGAAESGRLVLSTRDEYGRLAGIGSVDVILLALGEADILPPGADLEPLVIREPRPKTLVQGGALVVAGEVWPDPFGVLYLELLDSKGQVLGSRQIEIGAPDARGYAPFTVELSYQLEKSTWARLTISQRGIRPQGITRLASVEVYVSP